MTEKTEAELTSGGVDIREWGPTEDDEEAVLRDLYGEPDENGIYRGEGA
ncbi:hypothetical protein ACQP2T_63490 (plasmid) [Nonomuraea sp. CA-143628]